MRSRKKGSASTRGTASLKPDTFHVEHATARKRSKRVPPHPGGANSSVLGPDVPRGTRHGLKASHPAVGAVSGNCPALLSLDRARRSTWNTPRPESAQSECLRIPMEPHSPVIGSDVPRGTRHGQKASHPPGAAPPGTDPPSRARRGSDVPRGTRHGQKASQPTVGWPYPGAALPFCAWIGPAVPRGTRHGQKALKASAPASRWSRTALSPVPTFHVEHAMARKPLIHPEQPRPPEPGGGPTFHVEHAMARKLLICPIGPPPESP
jgi:hypothetical protein